MKKTLLSLLVCIAPFCVLAQLPSYLPTDGLVGWWPFNGNANDESGNGNDLTSISVSYTSDRLGNNNSSAKFNGQGSVAYSLNNTAFTPSSYSISIWINTDTMQFGSLGGPEQQDIIGFRPFNWFNGPAFGLSLFLTDNSRVLHRHWTPNTSWIDNYMPQGTVTTDHWYHLFISYDFSSSQQSLYFNGQLYATIPSTIEYVGQEGLFIGSSHETPTGALGNFFQGSIDDIAFYNRALTQEEITALYTATPTNGGGGGSNIASANVPQGISYQAVARNAQGQPLSNAALQVKFTLLADSLTGAAEYSELHSLTTNDLGLFTTAFGAGTPLSGIFANINWASGNKYLKVEMDAGGGFIALGTQQMLSVPYALQAKKSTLIENNALPVYSNNAAALAGGLQAGQMYRTAAGVLMVVY